MKGVPWPQSTKTVYAQPQVNFRTSALWGVWRDAQVDYADFLWTPTGIVVGAEPSLVVFAAVTTGTGNASFEYSTFRYRPGAAGVIFYNYGPVTLTFSSTNVVYVMTLPFGSPAVSPGEDVTVWTVRRQGSAGGDTVASDVLFLGSLVTYTGYAGRN
jgi:hypothetical protein